mmetsp:Transcript_11513/g.28360  ORF Transcript_11513/g.28360 Transcript_11513/m.28360 type:complete len:776 (-) Transcript_11513:31-2358(-)
MTKNQPTTMAPMSSSSSSIMRGPCHEEFPWRGDNVGSLVGGRVNNNYCRARNANKPRCRRRDAGRRRRPTEKRRYAPSNDDDGNNASRGCRRRRSACVVDGGWSLSPSANALVAVVATCVTIIANSIAGASAFAPTGRARITIPSSPTALSLQHHPSLTLSAVRKRSGNHDHPSRKQAAATISAASRSQTAARKVKAPGGKRKATAAAASAAPTMEAGASARVVPSPPAAASTTRRGPRTRKRNVFEQFTPEYMTSPYDVDLSPGGGEDNTGAATVAQQSSNVVRSRIAKNNKINLRLRSLLTDDTGEQENEMFPDHSPEAAEQLADRRSYSKMSEEARRKANLAVKSDDDDDDEEDERDVVGKGRTQRTAAGKRRTARRIKVASDLGEDDDDGGDEHGGGGNMVTLTPPSVRVVASPQRQRRRVVRATIKETGTDSVKTYIKSLGQHELLFKEDEVLLGQQVRILTALEEKRQELEEELLRPPTFAQWAEATNLTVPSLKQQIRRSQRAKAALIEANLRLVVTVARQAVKKSPLLPSSRGANSVQFQDACQQGIIGLTRATEKFDPALGFRFSTYAIWWIQKEVARNVSEQSRSVRVPSSAIKKINDIRIQERVLMNELGRRPDDEELSERVGMSVRKLEFYRKSAQEVSSLDKGIDARTGKGSMSTGGDSGNGATMETFVRDTEHPSPTELVEQEVLKEDVRRLVRTLSPREQAVIRLRFGLDDGHEPMGLADIGAKFGVDKVKIKKIEASALLKMRQPKRSQVVKCYVSDHT